jgi:hypothetical protein
MTTPPPEWLDRLRAGGSTGPWTLVSDAEAGERRRAALAREYDDNLPAVLDEDRRRRLERSSAVADGPALPDWQIGEYARATLYFDEASPETLWLDIGMVPPVLWIPAGTTFAAADEAAARYFGGARPGRLKLPCTSRFLLGTPGSVLYNVYTGERYDDEQMSAEDMLFEYSKQAVFNVAIENVSWGSAFDDDPIPYDKLRGASAPAVAVLTRETSQQKPGRIPSLSWRTRWSGSIFSVEAHFDYFLVVQLRYAPAPHEAVLRQLNELCGTALPEDLPVDAALALFGYTPLGERNIIAAVSGGGVVTDRDVYALASVLHEDLRLQDHLLRLAAAGNVHVRRAAATVAARYQYDAVLQRLWAAESDAELGDAFRRQIADPDSIPELEPVPEPSAMAASVERALLPAGFDREALARLARAGGWKLDAATGRSRSEWFGWVWTPGDPASTVVYMENHQRGARLLLTSGLSAAQRAELAALGQPIGLGDAVAAWRAAREPTERIAALNQLAALTDDRPDAAVLGAYAEGLASDVEPVRWTALNVAASAGEVSEAILRAHVDDPAIGAAVRQALGE